MWVLYFQCGMQLMKVVALEEIVIHRVVAVDAVLVEVVPAEARVAAVGGVEEIRCAEYFVEVSLRKELFPHEELKYIVN